VSSCAPPTLANGLRIIVWPVHDIPSVALNKLGARWQSQRSPPGITAWPTSSSSMMFNGTTRRQPGEFDRLMEAQGAPINAFTSDDVTVYQDWFPRNALELVLDLESDRVANLAFTPAVMKASAGCGVVGASASSRRQ